ncbi:MAG: OmpA family protein [Acidobacteriota bacterium]
MLRRLFVPAFLLALLCWWCLRHHAPRIESSLAAAAQQRLAEAGFPDLTATVDGRDLTLDGQVDSPRASSIAEQTVGEIHGLRTVTNLLAVTPGPAIPAAAGAAYLELGSDDSDTIRLGGQVGDEESRRGLVSAAGEAFGAERIRDELELRPGAPAWDSFRAWLASYDSPPFEGVQWRFEEGILRLRGRVFDQGARQRLTAVAAASLPAGIELVDELEIIPPTSAADLQRSLDQTVQLQNVEFESGSARLTAVGRATLDGIAEALAKLPALEVEIAGHTDSQGDPAFNLQLSRDRAAATRVYLTDRGITADRMTAVGYGQTRPIADNATAEGRRRNRRIEFQVRED